MVDHVDYLSVLRRQVDASIRHFQAERGRLPRGIVLTRSQYTLLEDYCIAREVAAWMQAVSQLARSDAETRAACTKACIQAEQRLARLRKDGVIYFTCNAGNLRIQIDPDADTLKLI